MTPEERAEEIAAALGAYSQLLAALDEWKAMSDASYEDMNDCATRFTEGDHTIAPRQLTRAMFADIEGSLSAMRGLALSSAGLGLGSMLSDGDLAMLHQRTYELGNEGTVLIRSARVPFLAAFQFAFDCCARAFGVGYKLDKSGEGWAGLRAAVQLRDRLTHPKTATDLVMKDEETNQVLLAHRWYRVCRHALQKAIHDKLQDRIDQQRR